MWKTWQHYWLVFLPWHSLNITEVWGPFLESLDNWRARKAVVVYMQDRGFNSFASNMIKLSVNETKWSSFLSQDPRSYSFYFDLNIWFRARKVSGTFEKRAPAGSLEKEAARCFYVLLVKYHGWISCKQRLHFRGMSWRVKSSRRQPFNFLSCMRKIRHAIRKQLVRQICVSFARTPLLELLFLLCLPLILSTLAGKFPGIVFLGKYFATNYSESFMLCGEFNSKRQFFPA